MALLKKINDNLIKVERDDSVFGIVLIALFIMHLRPISSYNFVRLIAPSVLFYLLASTGFWYLRKVGNGRDRSLQPHCVIIYFLFLIYTFILIYVSPSSFESKKIFGQFLIGFIVFFIAYITFNKSQYINYIIVFFILLSFLLSAFGIFQYHFYFNYLLKKYQGVDTGNDQLLGGIIYALRHKRIGSTFGAANIFAGFLTLTFPFYLYVLIDAKKRIVRLIIALLLMVFLYAFFLTSSRGGLLTLIFSFFVTSLLFSLKDKRMMRTFLIVLIVLVILAVAILLVVNLFWQKEKQQEQGIQSPSFFDRLLSSSTIRDRITYLKVGMQLFFRKPLIGYGCGAYAILCSWFLPTTSGSKFAHNFIIQLLCETGIIGTLLFLIFAVLIFKIVIKGIYKPSGEGYTLAKIAIFASMLTFLFNSLLEYSFYFEELFIDWMLLSGMALGLASKDIKNDLTRIDRIYRINKIMIKHHPDNPLYPVYPVKFFSFAIVIVLLLCGLVYTVCLPALSDLYEERGRSFYDAGNDKYAVVMLKQSLLFSKDNYKAYIGLSHLSMSPSPFYGSPNFVIHYLKEAIKYNPFQAYIHNDLGNYYLNIGMYKEAYDELGLAVKYFPANTKYREDLQKAVDLSEGRKRK